jgi:hypothetical protein
MYSQAAAPGAGSRKARKTTHTLLASTVASGAKHYQNFPPGATPNAKASKVALKLGLATDQMPGIAASLKIMLRTRVLLVDT